MLQIRCAFKIQAITKNQRSNRGYFVPFSLVKGVKVKKKYHKRFGSIAVEKGFITKNQLFQALKIQAKENLEEGKHRLIGEILMDEGLLTASQVDEILETMNQQIMYMISAGR